MTKRTDPAVTLADVARRAGTSTAVVSYVINDGPRPVAEATRQRVLAAAADLGYRPNRLASALRSRTSGVVGLVLAEASNPYFAELARHLEQALDARGKLTLIGNAGYAADRQQDLVDRFLAARADGLVIVSADGDTDVAADAQQAGVPAVYVHNLPATARSPVIAADNHAAVHRAAAHLHAHGHERIAFLAGPRDTGPVDQRRRAWRAAVPDAQLLRSDYSRASAASLVQHLAGTGALPDALITATDEQAIGVLAGAWSAGCPAPEHLALISLDGTPDSGYTAPPLTATRQPMADMAEHAVDRLFNSTAAPPDLTADLVVRRSCGCEDGASTSVPEA